MVFSCKENCGACCGIVPVPKEVYEKYKDKLPLHESVKTEKGVIAFRKDGTCAFLTDAKKCLIYDERSEVCRLYGNSTQAWTNPGLMCPFFHPDGSIRNRGERRRIFRDIKGFFKKVEKLVSKGDNGPIHL